MGVNGWKYLRDKVRDGSFNRLNLPINEISEHHRKDISEIVININEYIHSSISVPKSVPKSCTICRVPANLREVHKQAYDPKLVSIGPLHSDKPYLKAMEEHKLRFLSRLLVGSEANDQLHKMGNIEKSLIEKGKQCELVSDATSSSSTVGDAGKIERLAGAMKVLEVQARGCYSENFNHIYGPNEFVLMMIRDGCFIIELLRLYANCDKEDVDDPIFTTRWMMPNLQRDLLLLENQLPFIVLEQIFEITSSENDAYTLQELAIKFFDPLMPREKKMSETCILDEKPDHLLGLFRSSFLLSFKERKASHSRKDKIPSSSTRQEIDQTKQTDNTNARVQDRVDRQLIHCVAELKEAGVRFIRRDNHDLLDIGFKDGELQIPPILIDDQTGPVFLNFVAYEQCDRYAEPYFTPYVLFFDSLVNTSKDVEILHYEGIIDHVLGCDEDVADLFNKLCKEVVHDLGNCYLSKELKEINQYYSTDWNKWRAKWKHDYFSSPWAFSSFLAAILLLFLTAVQSFFSFFSYALPPS